MTLSDEQTIVLPAAPEPADEGADAERPSPAGLVVVLIVVLLALIAAAFWTADGIIRAQVEHTVADKWRAAFGVPDTQRLDVEVAGPVVPQALLGRLDSVTVTAANMAVGPTTVELTTAFGGVQLADEKLTTETASGEMRLGSAQATALLVPAESARAAQVGFRGTDVTLDVVVTSAGRRVPVSVALSPRLEAGALQVAPVSVTAGGNTVSVADLATTVGTQGASAVQPPAVCLASLFPRFVTVRSVAVRDQHLTVGFDVDMPSSHSIAAQPPGACS